jgi:hypothetical protein
MNEKVKYPKKVQRVVLAAFAAVGDERAAIGDPRGPALLALADSLLHYGFAARQVTELLCHLDLRLPPQRQHLPWPRNDPAEMVEALIASLPRMAARAPADA